MSNRTHSENDSERPTGFETAARTRPLSIQDIMLRREKKAASEAKKTNEGLQDSGNGKSHCFEPGRRYKNRKDLKDVPVEGSKKEEIRHTPSEESKKDDQRNMSREVPKKDSMRSTPKEASKKENLKDQPKDSSEMDDLKDTPSVPKKDYQKYAPKKSFKKERSFIRNDNHPISRDKDTYSSHKLSKSTSRRADESKYGNRGDIRSRDDDAIRSESLNGPRKRWNDEIADDHRIKERSEKLWKETKRKDRGFVDEKSSEVDRLILKKDDSARSHVLKHSARNYERKEYATMMYHEEPSSKRRRSRSRDHDRERRGRSSSLSPREQRHNYLGHGHDNNSQYYLMDKFRKNHAKADRHRTYRNDEHDNGSYKRYGSRLGGYSPRKRKTVPKEDQETIKTTPSVDRSPEKKPATWDQPPTGPDQSSLPTSLQPTVSQLAYLGSVSFTASKQNPATTVETILSETSLSIDSVQLTQATRPLRRLHIENLPSSATEGLVIGYLNDLLSSGVKRILRSKQPCLSCTINKEKRQAIVEFLTPEDATAAISFDGRSFNGCALKIRRPKEYVEMTNVSPKNPAEEIKVISDVVADSAHKIFIAGISAVISSEMLAEIVSAFGRLAAYRFICNEDLGGRCAFLEYVDHSITSKACAGLNGMKLGRGTLTAVQVFPNSPEEASNEASPFYGIPDSAKSLLEEPTKVLQLKNVFYQEEYLLLAKSEVDEILEDVRMECIRFGAVKSINYLQYPASTNKSTEESIKIEPTERAVIENCTEAATDCSSPIKSVDLPGHSGPTDIKQADPLSECQDHKELDKLCERDVPAASDQHTDLDLIDAKPAVPLLDGQTEVNHTDSIQADYQGTAVGDDSAAGGGRADPATSEIGCCTTPEDVERSEKETEQQGASDVRGSCTGKLPVADPRSDALVSDTDVLEAGSILVEFLREEAACMAAHCLHGRRFGNRIVSVGYVQHDLYLQRYPR